MNNLKTKEKSNLITDFTEGKVSKQLLIFAAPLFLSSLLQIVYNMVDMIIVGRVYGETGLSAVSVGGDITNFMTFLAMGFANAGQIIISQYIGAGQKEKTGRFVSTMFSVLMFIAVIVGGLCLVFRHGILNLMNTPEESYTQTLSYLTISIAGLFFIYGYNIAGAVLRGMGDSKHPFIFISIASVLNLILDIIFVAHFKMGAGGAALATIISQGVSFLCSAAFLYKNRNRFQLEFKFKDFIFIDTDMLSSLLKLGFPMAIKFASVMLSKLFVNSWINSYGVVVSAVAGIANKFASISNLISNSINTAGSTMASQNIGAEKYERVPRIMLTAFAVTFTIASLMTAVLLYFPEQVFNIFTDKKEVHMVCMEFLPIAVLLFYGSALRAPMNVLINGSGNYPVNFATALLDGIILRIGLSLLFGIGLKMEYTGFWLGDALAGFTPFVLGIVFLISGKWKTNKYIIKK